MEPSAVRRLLTGLDHAEVAENCARLPDAWKRTRPQSPRITITRDDTTIALTTFSDDEVRRVIRVLDDGQSPVRSP
ncbi:hypothetical protein ACIPPM_19435 [Streptomyces sp. NPDC090119]|uniref:effector-associated constant component EACC1 n=1 Tax=Streptomyces sp. NPDC090119 TaxID=3365951 RepID=UPI00382D4DCE